MWNKCSRQKRRRIIWLLSGISSRKICQFIMMIASFASSFLSFPLYQIAFANGWTMSERPAQSSVSSFRLYHHELCRVCLEYIYKWNHANWLYCHTYNYIHLINNIHYIMNSFFFMFAFINEFDSDSVNSARKQQSTNSIRFRLDRHRQIVNL